MSFKNPLDEEKIKRIGEIAGNTIKVYSTEYMKAFKDCLIETIAEGKPEEKAKEPSVPVAFIVASIQSTDTKTKAGKKYTAYTTQIVVVKPKGSSFKIVPIRYSQFRTFNEQFLNCSLNVLN